MKYRYIYKAGDYDMNEVYHKEDSRRKWSEAEIEAFEKTLKQTYPKSVYIRFVREEKL